MIEVLRRPAAGALAVLFALFALPGSALAADMNAVNHAASIASAVGAGTAAPSLGIGAVLQTLFGLAAVVALVLACAWVARRTGFAPGARGHIVRTVGGVSLGGKERVAVVEIGDTWLVLGAAPGNVRLLHTLPAGSKDAAHAAGGGLGSGGPDGGHPASPTSFSSRFRAALAAETKKRFFLPSGGGK
ncbi:flagellar biosynthetic protein FliO [Trinickia sp. EG282A]|uniref:flagellar biosynthetic protein FliO n=1 Tax=Trinickia sp. EG282A TaxID=3237013 RepID=UPI0034D20AB5